MSQTDETRVVVGRVAGLFGVRGWVKVVSHTVPAANILDYRPWQLWLDGRWQAMEVAEQRVGGNRVTARFEGFDDRDAAAPLLGADIAIERDQLPPAGDQSYYWADLVGLEVRDQQDTVMGTVHHLLETGANDVLVVRGDRERLIPFVRGSVIVDVDLESRVIRVDWDADY